jgi:hypothetical protein
LRRVKPRRDRRRLNDSVGRDRALDYATYLLDIWQSLSPVLEILGSIVPILPLLGRHLLVIESLHARMNGVEEGASDFQVSGEVDGVREIRLGELPLLLFFLFLCVRGQDIVKVSLDCDA